MCVPYGVYLRLLHGVLLVSVHVRKGPVEASGCGHESMAMGRIGVHGGLRRRSSGEGKRRARDLHYVSARLATVVVVARVKRRAWGQVPTGSDSEGRCRWDA